MYIAAPRTHHEEVRLRVAEDLFVASAVYRQAGDKPGKNRRWRRLSVICPNRSAMMVQCAKAKAQAMNGAHRAANAKSRVTAAAASSRHHAPLLLRFLVTESCCFCTRARSSGRHTGAIVAHAFLAAQSAVEKLISGAVAAHHQSAKKV